MVMATITRYPFVRHLNGSATSYVQHLKGGRVRAQGVGTGFWFRPLGSAISEIPVDDRELPMLFHGRTADFFDVTVQGTITYRVVDPATAAQRVDFSVDPGTGRWGAQPLDQLAGLLVESAQQNTAQLLTRHTLVEAIAGGVEAAREAISAGLAADRRLLETGVEVIAVRILAIRPEPEIEKALQTPARELVQQEADKATFERRAVAVEREAAIGENELHNQIELARREEDLVAQRGQNNRRQAELEAATDAVRTRAEAERVELTGAAEASAETARLAAYATVPEKVLFAMAARELAQNMPDLRSLVVSPDALAPLLSRLVAEPQATDAGEAEAR
jgi:regulator of protease activity HflC (stomatin/prohibitin superfamily)